MLLPQNKHKKKTNISLLLLLTQAKSQYPYVVAFALWSTLLPSYFDVNLVCDNTDVNVTPLTQPVTDNVTVTVGKHTVSNTEGRRRNSHEMFDMNYSGPFNVFVASSSNTNVRNIYPAKLG